MKRSKVISTILLLIILGVYYYLFLPVINIHAPSFWAFIVFGLIVFMFLFSTVTIFDFKTKFRTRFNALPKIILIPAAVIVLICVGQVVVNFFASPIFNAKSYHRRINVDETGDFSKDIKEVDFKRIPLLDRDSSEKLGDRIMGQMSEYVSQFYVSDEYTQINYNDDIVRVTPIEYDGFIKWITNQKKGINAYITVNSVNGKTKLTKLDRGLKYLPSAYFNENLNRKLRFKYPTTVLGTAKFEIDEEGQPYYVAPTLKYTGVGLKTKITGAVIIDPITGESHKYKMKDVPSYVDNVYYADLVIEQINDWGKYKKGFINSKIGQKNVVNTTDGYNYLALGDDIYLYTGITSVVSDESNLGFILANLRTGETTFYSVPGAEEYSAMESAEGQVQEMKYKSTFPLLISLNGNPTYLVSLKDAAGLVKMYGFVDAVDYQKVVVTDMKQGIEKAALNYLENYGEEISESLLVKETITVKKITSAVIDGNTYYYITSIDDKKFRVALKVSSSLPFISSGDQITIGYQTSEKSVLEINTIY